MQYRLILEADITQGKRCDLLRPVEQDRLIRPARVGRALGVKAGRPARAGLKVRMMWRRAVV